MEDLLLTAAEINLFESPPDTIHSDTVWNARFIISNNSGHNFPSGTTFARQLWLEVFAVANDDTLLASGFLDASGDIYDFYIDPNRNMDPQLSIFNTILYNAEGDSGLLKVSVENMVKMVDNTLPVSDSRIVDYSIPIPSGLNGQLELTARLRFRSFPPFYLRHLGLESLIENVNIFDIDTISETIYVSSN